MSIHNICFHGDIYTFLLNKTYHSTHYQSYFPTGVVLSLTGQTERYQDQLGSDWQTSDLKYQ